MERVMVIGAGLVGSLLAVFLARRGYRVDVFERHGDPRLRAPGAGRSINLTLCERGFRALDRVGAGERVRRITVPAYGRIIHNQDGTTTDQPYGNQREAIYSISRNDLNKILLDRAEEEPGITLHFEERCQEIDFEAVRVKLCNERTGLERDVAAARIFGADGAHSVVRQQLKRDGRSSYYQFYVDQRYTELSLPATQAGSFALNENAIHVWPRGHRMLIGFANRDGSFTLALHLPSEGEGSFESITDEADLLKLFRELFPDVLPHIPRLVEEYFAHPAVPMVTIRCAPWTCRDKVALIGDAAHAIVPSYGQGANSGFEDCSVLADCIDAAGGDWNAAFTAYEERRIPNAEAIADLALEHFWELQEHVADPTFILRKRLERRIDELYPESYIGLYSLVSFTDTPYLEAQRLDRERRPIVDRLVGIEGAGAMLDRGEMDSHIHEAFGAFVSLETAAESPRRAQRRV